MFVRSNWNNRIQTGLVVMERKQVERVAAVGSFVLIRGGDLYRSI